MATPQRRSIAYVCTICASAVPSIDESTSAVASLKHRYRPFCSERCQRIDLGNWLGEHYTVPGEPAKLDQAKPQSEDEDADDES